MSAASEARVLPARTGLGTGVDARLVGAVILAAGLALRLLLAFVLLPDSGHSADLGFFSSWASTLARTGPGSFYASAANADYPPGYLYVLWFVGALGGGVGLLKLPAILADVAIGAILWRAGRRWFGERVGLLAAALYLFVPVTWYDSAIWGQVDAVGALVVLAAVVLLADGWSEAAAALAGAAVLVKPQDAVVLVVLLPVLVRRHLLAVGRGPHPAAPSWAPGWLRALLTERGPVRLPSSAAAFLAVVVLGAAPFDIATFAPASLADVPVLGQLAGLVGLVVSDAGRYADLTVNAWNWWALVGDPSLASIVSTGGSWTADSTTILGIAASTLGTGLLAAVGLLVAGGLLLRSDRRAILVGLALAMFAFYALPTRVHERYLVPFFAPAALLAALGLARAIGYVAVAVANAANLHTVLVGSHAIGFGGFGGLGGGGFGGGFGAGPGGGPGAGIASVSLPFADLFANQAAVTVIALGQTAALGVLLVAWALLLLRRDREVDADRPAPPSSADR